MGAVLQEMALADLLGKLESDTENFGLLIANIVPGFVALMGASYFSETVRVWLGSSPVDAPTVGGFLYVSIASVASGLTVNSVRFLVVDTIHHWTGIRQPQWDFARLQQNIAAYKLLVEIHYNYYQFYSGMFVALLSVYVARRLSLGFLSAPLGWPDLGFLLVGLTYFVTSRDNLRKYYTRVAMLLGDDRSDSNTEDQILNSELPLPRLNPVHVAPKEQSSGLVVRRLDKRKQLKNCCDN